ncbi:MAG: hypothetical protein AAF492_04740, partial [Verrucomicrobiota bacterium]
MKRSILIALLLGLQTPRADIIRGDGDLDLLFPGFAERGGGKAAYDAGRDRLVRFGGDGYRQGHPLTSEWDGDACSNTSTEKDVLELLREYGEVEECNVLRDDKG